MNQNQIQFQIQTQINEIKQFQNDINNNLIQLQLTMQNTINEINSIQQIEQHPYNTQNQFDSEYLEIKTNKYNVLYNNNEHILNLFEIIQQLSDDMNDKQQQMKSFYLNYQETIGNENNEIVDQIKHLSSLKTYDRNESKYDQKYIETKRYKEMKDEKFKNEQNELNRYEYVKNIISKDEMTQLEQLVGKYFDEVIFDSTKNNWKINESTFHSQIMNKKNIVILIKSTKNYVFGCSFETTPNENEITSKQYHSDNNAFLFSFQNNEISKYPIKDASKALLIHQPTDTILFTVGKYEGLAIREFGDIVLMKEKKNVQSRCYPSSFEYYDQINVFGCDNNYFTVDKFIVLKMNSLETIEWKQVEKQRQERIERERLERERNKRLKSVENILSNDEMDQLEEMSGMKVENVLFTYPSNQTQNLKSIFFTNLMNTKNYLFCLETIDNYRFGSFISLNNSVSDGYAHSSNAFVYSSCDNDIQKYPIKDTSKALRIVGFDDYSKLMIIGKFFSLFSEYGDILVEEKNGKLFVSCNQSSFEYYGKRNALTNCNKSKELKCFYVIEMK